MTRRCDRVPLPNPADRSIPPTWTDADRDDLLADWAAGAELVDELELAEALWADVPDARGPRGLARAALLQGDPGRALTLLTSVGAGEVPDDGPRTFDDVLVLGARAALGSDEDMSRLLGLGAVLPAERQVPYLYVLATAAEPAGQPDVAAAAWRGLAEQHGVRTPHVVSRTVEHAVLARSADDPGRAAVQVLAAANDLAVGPAPPWDDPSTLLGVVAALEARGDRSGAALLARAVTLTGPSTPALRALGGTYRVRRRLWDVVVPALAAVLVVPVAVVVTGRPGAALLGALAAVLARAVGLRRWHTASGMSLTDGRAWDALAGHRRDSRSGRVTTSTPVHPVPTVTGLVGGAAGLALAGWWTDVTSPPSQLVPDGVALTVLLVVVLAAPALGVWIGVAVDRERRDRRARESRRGAAVVRHEVAGTCRCWQAAVLDGPFALDYAERHLRPAPAGAPGGRPGASTWSCPLSGTRWLLTTGRRAGSPVLLRGRAPRASADATVGGYL